jgi:hypothetical protein
MNSSVVVEAIAGAAAVIVAALSYLFTKTKEREADWREWKYEQYKEFVVSISGIVAGDATPEGNRIFAKACNTLHLIGSKGVLDALHAFQDESRSSNPNHSVEKEAALLSRLVWAIRKDVEIPGTPQAPEFSVQLWCSGTNLKK